MDLARRRGNDVRPLGIEILVAVADRHHLEVISLARAQTTMRKGARSVLFNGRRAVEIRVRRVTVNVRLRVRNRVEGKFKRATSAQLERRRRRRQLRLERRRVVGRPSRNIRGRAAVGQDAEVVRRVRGQTGKREGSGGRHQRVGRAKSRVGRVFAVITGRAFDGADRQLDLRRTRRDGFDRRRGQVDLRRRREGLFRPFRRFVSSGSDGFSAEVIRRIRVQTGNVDRAERGSYGRRVREIGARRILVNIGFRVRDVTDFELQRREVDRRSGDARRRELDLFRRRGNGRRPNGIFVSFAVAGGVNLDVIRRVRVQTANFERAGAVEFDRFGGFQAFFGRRVAVVVGRRVRNGVDRNFDRRRTGRVGGNVRRRQVDRARRRGDRVRPIGIDVSAAADRLRLEVVRFPRFEPGDFERARSRRRNDRRAGEIGVRRITVDVRRRVRNRVEGEFERRFFVRQRDAGRRRDQNGFFGRRVGRVPRRIEVEAGSDGVSAEVVPRIRLQPGNRQHAGRREFAARRVREVRVRRIFVNVPDGVLNLADVKRDFGSARRFGGNGRFVERGKVGGVGPFRNVRKLDFGANANVIRRVRLDSRKRRRRNVFRGLRNPTPVFAVRRNFDAEPEFVVRLVVPRDNDGFLVEVVVAKADVFRTHNRVVIRIRVAFERAQVDRAAALTLVADKVALDLFIRAHPIFRGFVVVENGGVFVAPDVGGGRIRAQVVTIIPLGGVPDEDFIALSDIDDPDARSPIVVVGQDVVAVNVAFVPGIKVAGRRPPPGVLALALVIRDNRVVNINRRSRAAVPVDVKPGTGVRGDVVGDRRVHDRQRPAVAVDAAAVVAPAIEFIFAAFLISRAAVFNDQVVRQENLPAVDVNRRAVPTGVPGVRRVKGTERAAGRRDRAAPAGGRGFVDPAAGAGTAAARPPTAAPTAAAGTASTEVTVRENRVVAEVAVGNFDETVENTDRAAVVDAAVVVFKNRVRREEFAGDRDRAAPLNRFRIRDDAHFERQLRPERNVQRAAVVVRVVRRVDAGVRVFRQLLAQFPRFAGFRVETDGAVRHVDADDSDVRSFGDIENTAIALRVDSDARMVLVVNEPFEVFEVVKVVTVDRDIFVDNDFAFRQDDINVSSVAIFLAQRRVEADRVAVLRVGDRPTKRTFGAVFEGRNAPNRRFGLRSRFNFRGGEGGGQVDRRVGVQDGRHFRGEGGVGLRGVVPGRRRQKFAFFQLFESQRSFFQHVPFHRAFPFLQPFAIVFLRGEKSSRPPCRAATSFYFKLIPALQYFKSTGGDAIFASKHLR